MRDKYTNRIVTGKIVKKRPVGRPIHSWEDNITIGI
jgi:hypothetical protein